MIILHVPSDTVSDIKAARIEHVGICSACHNEHLKLQKEKITIYNLNIEGQKVVFHVPDSLVGLFKTKHDVIVALSDTEMGVQKMCDASDPANSKRIRHWIINPSYERASIAYLNYRHVMDSHDFVQLIVLRSNQVETYKTHLWNEGRIIVVLPDDGKGIGHARWWIQAIAYFLNLPFIWVFDDNLVFFYELVPQTVKNSHQVIPFSTALKTLENQPDKHEYIIFGFYKFKGSYTNIQRPYQKTHVFSVIYMNAAAAKEHKLQYDKAEGCREDVSFNNRAKDKGLIIKYCRFMPFKVHCTVGGCSEYQQGKVKNEVDASWQDVTPAAVKLKLFSKSKQANCYNACVIRYIEQETANIAATILMSSNRKKEVIKQHFPSIVALNLLQVPSKLEKTVILYINADHELAWSMIEHYIESFVSTVEKVILIICTACFGETMYSFMSSQFEFKAAVLEMDCNELLQHRNNYARYIIKPTRIAKKRKLE